MAATLLEQVGDSESTPAARAVAGAAMLEPVPRSPQAALALQRAAGNRATTAAVLRSPAPPSRPLPAPPARPQAPGVVALEGLLSRAARERRATGSGGNRIVLAEVPVVQLQREEGGTPENASPAPSPAPPANASVVRDQSHFEPSPTVGESDARAIANDFIAKLAPQGAKVSYPPSDLVASNAPTQASEQTVQTWPAARMLMRSGSWAFEGGFVGSLQLCYDLCSAELSVVGWVWAGGGVETKGLLGGKSWWGAYVFAEREFGKWTLSFMPKLSCGTCAPGCGPDEAQKTEWGGGIGGFPIALKPGERASLKQAGIEIGALLTPHLTRCDADLEVIALIDLTKYLGPVGAAVASAEELVNKWAAKLNMEVSCGVGVDISGTVHLCKSVPGGGLAGITSDSARICGGGYVGCGIGLAHDKSALPGI